MAISLSFLVCSILLIASLLSAEQEQQQPLIQVGSGGEVKEIDLIYELQKAEIIPTVIDSFNPLLTVSISWKKSKAEYGNTIKPSRTQDTPVVKLLDQLPSIWTSRTVPQLTLVLTDPDAPSRDNPENSEHCHWIATSFSLTSPDEDYIESDFKEVMPYKPPGPPPSTGKHRYVFVALVPRNGTTESLNLRKPHDRNRWGYKHEREGLRQWSEEMGLSVVGANFIYAQNDEQ